MLLYRHNFNAEWIIQIQASLLKDSTTTIKKITPQKWWTILIGRNLGFAKENISIKRGATNLGRAKQDRANQGGLHLGR